MSFQKELKKVREQLGMTQSELGKAIGVSFSSINRYENGKHFPTPIVLNAIQTYFRSRGIDFTYDENDG